MVEGASPVLNHLKLDWQWESLSWFTIGGFEVGVNTAEAIVGNGRSTA